MVSFRSGEYTRRRIAGSQGNSRVNRLRNCKTSFHSSVPAASGTACRQRDGAGKKVKPQILCGLPVFREVDYYKVLPELQLHCWVFDGSRGTCGFRRASRTLPSMVVVTVPQSSAFYIPARRLSYPRGQLPVLMTKGDDGEAVIRLWPFASVFAISPRGYLAPGVTWLPAVGQRPSC